MKLFFKTVGFALILVLPGVFLTLEVGLRILPTFANEPLRSIILEAERIPYSNLRTYNGFSGGTRILLPSVKKTDLLVIGDSIPFGIYVKEKDIFTSLLQTKLQIPLVNLAVSSTAPSQYNLVLEEGMKYSPKLVLYFIFANDFSDIKAHTDVDSLYLNDLNLKERIASVSKMITNFSLTYQLTKILKQPFIKNQSLHWQDKQRNYYFNTRNYWDPYLDYHLKSVRKKLDYTFDQIRVASELVVKKESRMLVVLLPSKEMTYSKIAKEVSRQIHQASYDETYLKLVSLLRKENIEAVDLTEKIRETALNTGNIFHTIDGHYNEEGHRVIASLLEKPILSTLQDRKILSASLEN